MERIPASSPLRREATDFLVLTDPDPADPAAVEAAAADILKTQKDYLPALMVEAARLARSGSLEEAARIYDAVLEEREDFSPAFLPLAAILSGNPERLADAERWALRALQGGTEARLEVERILGEVKARRGDPAGAIPHLEKCDRANQLDAEGLFLLGAAYLEGEPAKTAEAENALNRALNAGLEPELERQANELLKRTSAPSSP